MNTYRKYITNLEDIIILLLIVTILGFKDYPIMIYIMTIISFIYEVISTYKKNKLSKNIIPFLINKIAFILFGLLSAIWALNKDIINPLVFRLIYRLTICLTIILYIRDKNNLKKTIYYMIIASIILCIRLLINVPLEAWGKKRVGNYLAHSQDHTYGNTGITHVLGIVGIFIITSNFIKNKRVKIFLLTLFTLFSFFSGSKKQIIYLAISIPLLLLFKIKNRKDIMKNIFLGLIFIILLFILILKVNILYNIIGIRMLQMLSYFFDNLKVTVDPSTVSRMNFLKDSWNVFLSHPIIGIGLGGYQYVNSTEFVWAENTFLELLADLGIIGTILYYSLHFNIFVSVLKRIKNKNPIDIQIFIIFICIIVTDLFMVSYNNETLQLYLTIIYCENILGKKCYEKRY